MIFLVLFMKIIMGFFRFSQKKLPAPAIPQYFTFIIITSSVQTTECMHVKCCVTHRMAVLAIVLPCKKHYVRSRKYLISQLGKVPIFKWILVNIYLFQLSNTG